MVERVLPAIDRVTKAVGPPTEFELLTAMVFRWYKNEDRGWMHDSTVEVVK